MREGDKKIDFVHRAGSFVHMSSKNLLICLYVYLIVHLDGTSVHMSSEYYGYYMSICLVYLSI